MKKFVILSLLVIVTTAFADSTITSNISQPTDGFSNNVGPTQWVAMGFTTDNTEYLLTSVELLMNTTTSNGSGGFTLAIHDNNGGEPGTLIETLVGDTDPVTTGIYTYTSSGVSLDANTKYHIVASVISGRSFRWSRTTTDGETGPGSIDNNINLSFDQGASWFGGFPSETRFEVRGNAIPEPSTYLLSLLCLALFYIKKRK